jgi:hypothetical protein
MTNGLKSSFAQSRRALPVNIEPTRNSLSKLRYATRSTDRAKAPYLNQSHYSSPRFMSNPNDKMRRLYEARFPHFKNIEDHCFTWPDGHPTILFTRDKHEEYTARIQNVELTVHSLGYAITAWSEETIRPLRR